MKTCPNCKVELFAQSSHELDGEPHTPKRCIAVLKATCKTWAVRHAALWVRLAKARGALYDFPESKRRTRALAQTLTNDAPELALIDSERAALLVIERAMGSAYMRGGEAASSKIKAPNKRR